VVRNGIHWNVPTLLALHKENVPFSITSIPNSKASFIHMPLLVIEGTRFSCVDLLLCGSRVGGQFFLFATRGRLFLFDVCKPNMMLYCLRRIVKFMITLNFLVLASSNFVECVLAQPRVSLSLSCKQPKNRESVINLGIWLWHVLGVLC